MDEKEEQEEPKITLRQRMLEYSIVGVTTAFGAFLGMKTHPIMIEMGGLTGAVIGMIIVLIINWVVPSFSVGKYN